MRHLAFPFVVLAVAACAQATDPTRQLQLSPPAERAVSARPKLTVDSLLETLSVRAKVGQLIMPWLSGSYIATETDAFDTAAAWVEEFGVGGIIISAGSPLDAAAKLNRLQRRSRLPLMVAADLEFGAAMRMIGATAFPMPMAFGATGRELDALWSPRSLPFSSRQIRFRGVDHALGPSSQLVGDCFERRCLFGIGNSVDLSHQLDKLIHFVAEWLVCPDTRQQRARAPPHAELNEEQPEQHE